MVFSPPDKDAIHDSLRSNYEPYSLFRLTSRPLRVLARCGTAAAGMRVQDAKHRGAKSQQHARYPKRRAQG